MDTKSLIMKLPNFDTLVKEIESQFKDKEIDFSNDLNASVNDNSVNVLLCRYREQEGKHSLAVVPKEIGNCFVNAYSNSAIEKRALKEDLFLQYIGELKQGFNLAVLSKTAKAEGENGEVIEVTKDEVIDVPQNTNKKAKKNTQGK